MSATNQSFESLESATPQQKSEQPTTKTTNPATNIKDPVMKHWPLYLGLFWLVTLAIFIFTAFVLDVGKNGVEVKKGGDDKLEKARGQDFSTNMKQSIEDLLPESKSVFAGRRVLNQIMAKTKSPKGGDIPGHPLGKEIEENNKRHLDVKTGCKGEGPRYGDFKCNHDHTHRVCATLVECDGTKVRKEIKWGSSDFWQITGQKAFDWATKLCEEPNSGEGWCICMWATARLIKAVGCDNVHINCDGTDVTHVLNSYNDGGENLLEAHKCLAKKCPQGESGSGLIEGGKK